LGWAQLRPWLQPEVQGHGGLLVRGGGLATGRLALIDRLAAVLTRTPDQLQPTVCYLCQGLIASEFADIDLGLPEKLAIQAVATATGNPPEQVAASVRAAGDLGQAAEQLLAVTAANRPAILPVSGVVDARCLSGCPDPCA
jgi:hypothetical protein